MYQSIPVLDFGSQTAQLIVRRLRELGVYSELLAHDVSEAQVRALNPCGIVLSGGPASVYAPGAPGMPAWLPDIGLPVLGICYGMQLQAHVLGGRVEGEQSREFGPAVLSIHDTGELFIGMHAFQDVWMSHGDHIAALPPGFETLASSPGAPFAAAGDPQRSGYVIEFHPHVPHTVDCHTTTRNLALV